jgi:hypothetical protein
MLACIGVRQATCRMTGYSETIVLFSKVLDFGQVVFAHDGQRGLHGLWFGYIDKQLQGRDEGQPGALVRFSAGNSGWQY